MTLPLPSSVADPATQQNFDRIAEQFPIQPQNLAKPASESVAAAEKLKIIRGIVNTTTTAIVKGSGFTIAKPSTGKIVITFTTPFSDTPAVTCTPGDASHIATIIEETTKEKVVTITIASTFAPNDGTFHFIAMGPR